MKKFLLILAFIPTLALSQHYHGYGMHHQGYYRGPGFGWWAAPVVGGLIGYELARQQQQPVIIQQPVIVQQPQVCTPWIETQHPDGTITRTRTCNQ
jgi:hypothetical protein